MDPGAPKGAALKDPKMVLLSKKSRNKKAKDSGRDIKLQKKIILAADDQSRSSIRKARY
jgi:hypothetical protein